MRKLLFVGFLCVLLSCSKSEDDNSSSTTRNIVGKWHLTSIMENGILLTGITCNTNYDITEFTSTGKSMISYADIDIHGNCTKYSENGTYTVSNNIIEVVEIKNGIKVYDSRSKITELTATTLKTSTLYLYEADLQGHSNTSTYKEGEDVIIYKKL